MDEVLDSPEDLADYRQWLQLDVTGQAIVVDPESNLPITECPTFIERDLCDGFEFLQTYADKLEITVAYGIHDTGENLSLPNDVLWLEHQLASTNLLLHESNEQLPRQWLNAIRTQVGSNPSGEVRKGMSFDDRLTLAVAEANVPDAPCEAGDDDNSRTARILADMSEQIVDFHYRNESVPELLQYLQGILRSYAMVGYAGRRIAQGVEGSHELATKMQQDKLRVLLPVGLAHREMTRIFGDQGVVVREVLLAQNETSPMVELARTARVPDEMLDQSK